MRAGRACESRRGALAASRNSLLATKKKAAEPPCAGGKAAPRGLCIKLSGLQTLEQTAQKAAAFFSVIRALFDCISHAGINSGKGVLLIFLPFCSILLTWLAPLRLCLTHLDQRWEGGLIFWIF